MKDPVIQTFIICISIIAVFAIMAGCEVTRYKIKQPTSVLENIGAIRP